MSPRTFAILIGLAGLSIALNLWDGSASSDVSGDDSGDGTDSTDSTDDSGESLNDIIQTWALTIKTQEGWFAGSHSYRNNNPGNIKGVGDAGTDPDGFAIYSSYAVGYAALVADLTAKMAKYPGYTIFQIAGRYSKTDVQAYANNIAAAFSKLLGHPVTTDTTLAQVQGMAGAQASDSTPDSSTDIGDDDEVDG